MVVFLPSAGRISIYCCRAVHCRRCRQRSVPAAFPKPIALVAMAPINGYDGVSVIDIRQKGLGVSLVDEIREKLRPGKGEEKRLPTLLLYDERGLKIFEDITYLDEYYLTNAEIEVLTTHATEIAQSLREGSMIVELGSGYELAFLVEQTRT